MTRQQAAMLVFLGVREPQPWIEVVSIVGVLGDGFLRQIAGAIDRSAIAGLDELVRNGLVEASKPSGLRYRLTPRGRAAVDEALRRHATPPAHQAELSL